MSFEIRLATAEDASGIVALLAEHWSDQGWSLAKHRHYYRNYPEGEALGFIALEDDRVVAHFGLLPIHVSGVPGYLVLQVLVSRAHRRGGTLVELVRFGEDDARRRGARFLCGFGNIRFAKVAERFLRWKIAGYLRFAHVDAIDLASYRQRLHFEYGPSWSQWKLGADERVAVRSYAKDGATYHQLLKTQGFPSLRARELDVPSLHLWHPDMTSLEAPSDWSQPLVVRPLVDDLPVDFLDLRRWYVEMGDSDTFEPYRPWR